MVAKILIISLMVGFALAHPRPGIFKQAGEGVGNFFQKTGEVLHNAGETIHDGASNVVQKTGETLQNAHEAIHEGAENVVQKTGETLHNAHEAIHEGVENVVQKTGETLHNTGEAIEEGSKKLVQKTGETIDNIEQNIKETGEKIADKAQKIATGEEPIVDLAVNTRVKILDNEVGIEGKLVLGVKQAGFHGSADATVLGQSAKVHADILDAHKDNDQAGHDHDHKENQKSSTNTGYPINGQSDPVNYQVVNGQLVAIQTNGQPVNLPNEYYTNTVSVNRLPTDQVVYNTNGGNLIPVNNPNGALERPVYRLPPNTYPTDRIVYNSNNNLNDQFESLDRPVYQLPVNNIQNSAIDKPVYRLPTNSDPANTIIYNNNDLNHQHNNNNNPNAALDRPVYRLPLNTDATNTFIYNNDLNRQPSNNINAYNNNYPNAAIDRPVYRLPANSDPSNGVVYNNNDLNHQHINNINDYSSGSLDRRVYRLPNIKTNNNSNAATDKPVNKLPVYADSENGIIYNNDDLNSQSINNVDEYNIGSLDRPVYRYPVKSIPNDNIQLSI